MFLTLVGLVRAESLALVLSGGGARGFAHIGVLKALEERGIVPDLIVGTSMGAVIGGLYASGYSVAEIERISTSTDWSDLFLDRPTRRSLFLSQKEARSRHLLTIGFDGWRPELPLAIASGHSLSTLFFELIARAPYRAWESFDDLKIPFRAIATDLNSGQGIVFQSGDLAEVLRASISMPLLFAPYKMDSLLLLDGGIADNVPVRTARDCGATFVITVDASSPLAATTRLDYPWQLLDRVTTMMQQEKLRSGRKDSDLLIVPNLANQTSTDFGHTRSAIDSGYVAAITALNTTPLARLTSSRASRQSLSFASRSVTATLGGTGLDTLQSPQSYKFSGIFAIPDSNLTHIPAGTDGLNKFSLLRKMLMDDDLPLAHMTAIADSGTRWESHWDEGRIASIRVDGVKRSRPAAILKEFPLKPGDTFRFRRAKRGIIELYGSDRFESLALAILPSDSGANLVLRAEEPPSPLLRVGAGFSTERKGRGFLEFSNDNLLNIGARLRMFGKYGESDEEISGIVSFDRLPLTSPLDRLTSSYLTTELRGGWSRQENNFYTPNHRAQDFFFFERYNLDLALGRAFRRSGILWYGVRLESHRVGGVKSETTASTTAFGVRLHIDTKDRFQFPRQGIELRARYEFVAENGSDSRSHNQVAGFADGFLPLIKRTVFHSRLEYGWNDRILPLWGQYALGGQDQMLGLHEHEKFGNSMSALLSELRYDLLSRLIADAYWSVSYSVGAISDESHPAPQSDDIIHAVGASFGLSTLLGPMKLTAARLLESKATTAHTIFYLNLGHNF